MADGGGPGRFRGGAPVEFATVPHRLPTGVANLMTLASGVSVPAGRGLGGGEPGAPAVNVILRATNIRELFAAGQLPGPGEVRGAVEVPAAKSRLVWHEDDVVIGSLAGGGGFGDPIRREPAAVERDVALGLVSDSEAERVYGVVLGDSDATVARRAAIRSGRVPHAPAPIEGAVLYPIFDCVEAVLTGDGERVVRCSKCCQRLCAEGEELEAALPSRERELAEAGPHNGGCLPEFALRDWFCPGCATTLDCQVVWRR